MVIGFFSKIMFTFCLLSLFSSCNLDTAVKVLCGDLSEDEKRRVRAANTRYEQFG